MIPDRITVKGKTSLIKLIADFFVHVGAVKQISELAFTAQRGNAGKMDAHIFIKIK